MKAIVNRILENNLNELKGLSVEGQIPITEDFLNELIGAYLESSSHQLAAETSSSPSPAGGIDFQRIINSLDQKEVKIELKDKHALLKINAKKF